MPKTASRARTKTQTKTQTNTQTNTPPKTSTSGQTSPTTDHLPPKPANTAARSSALAAAATVLAEHPGSLSARELIERMTERGLWTSPAGKTPAATLYAAIIRDIAAHPDTTRFCKAAPGRFAAAAPAKRTPKAAHPAAQPSVQPATQPTAQPAALTTDTTPAPIPPRKRRRTGTSA